MCDRRVRHTHEMVDGETIGIYDAFEVGDALMMFPKDDSLGAGQEEIANCRCVVEYSGDGNLPNGVDNDGESDIIISGAVSGALNPESQRATEHAKRYYDAVRKMTTDVARIARNTRYSEEQIQNIKNFIFLEKHDLGNGEIEYFEPNYEMAESWQRLIDGKNIQLHDLTLLRHETVEKHFMEIGYSQDEAHIMASREYNYKEESEKYYAEVNKHKTTR